MLWSCGIVSFIFFCIFCFGADRWDHCPAQRGVNYGAFFPIAGKKQRSSHPLMWQSLFWCRWLITLWIHWLWVLARKFAQPLYFLESDCILKVFKLITSLG